MNILEGGLAAGLLSAGAVMATGGLDNVAGQARHAVNQQIAAAVVSTAQLRSVLTATAVDDGYERYAGGLAATESGVVAALSLNSIGYSINEESRYVAFRVPTAPEETCEVRYFQATADKPWRVQLVSSVSGCGADSDVEAGAQQG